MTEAAQTSRPLPQRHGVHPLPAVFSGVRLAAALLMVLASRLGMTPLAIFWLVLGAAVSDYLDGWLARRIRRCSYEGKILDFLADKIFLAVSVLVLARSGVPDMTVAAVVAGYHLVVLLATTIISWGTGRPLIALPTGEKLVHIFSYVLVSAAAGATAFTGKEIYSKLAWMSGILTLAAIVFGAAGYLRLVRRLLARFTR